MSNKTALQKFAEKWTKGLIEGMTEFNAEIEFMSDLTALIDKGYVPKEQHQLIVDTADKMVEARLREELIAYDKWMYNHIHVDDEIPTPEQVADLYLKSRSHE